MPSNCNHNFFTFIGSPSHLLTSGITGGAIICLLVITRCICCFGIVIHIRIASVGLQFLSRIVVHVGADDNIFIGFHDGDG